MSESKTLWDDVVPRADPLRCQRCADCAAVATCLVQGMRREKPEDVPVVDDERCFGCYSCASACPHGAIILPRTL